jgi:hypothetical protein
MLVGAKRVDPEFIQRMTNLGGTAGNSSSRPIVDRRFLFCTSVIARKVFFLTKQSPTRNEIASGNGCPRNDKVIGGLYAR